MSHQPSRTQQPDATGRASGHLLVIAVVAIAAAAGGFAVWFQWSQTRRCLAFYGPDVARSVQSAARVELWQLSPGPRGQVVRGGVRDISDARGLVHLRHGLVEDANFAWDAPASAPLPAAAWNLAFAFYATADARQPATILAISTQEQGALTVVGRPGRIGLGRIASGLRRWLDATAAAASAQGE